MVMDNACICKGKLLVSIHFSIKAPANLASAESGLGVLVSFHFSIKTGANLPSAESGLRVLGFYIIVN